MEPESSQLLWDADRGFAQIIDSFWNSLKIFNAKVLCMVLYSRAPVVNSLPFSPSPQKERKSKLWKLTFTQPFLLLRAVVEPGRPLSGLVTLLILLRVKLIQVPDLHNRAS